MNSKIFKAILSVFLSVTVCLLTCTSAFAASSNKTYVKETVLSYGKTEDEAKKWLNDNGYEVLDHNLNEGADDIFSKKRAVYLGYKTTNNADEAITDMRLMNMNGGYSVQDYQILLEEQKASIGAFIDSFIVAVNEYRANYEKGQERARAAHDMLNMFLEDDTQQKMGDLLLNKIKEEYTEDEYNALSDEVKGKTADMTTILMQGNADIVLSIEQIIAIATDSGEDLWIERYSAAATYDDMLDELMESENLTVNEAEKKLAAEYDEQARSLASKLEAYKDYLDAYTNEELTLTSTKEELDAYAEAHSDFDSAIWFAAGVQYELLDVLENDGITLRELIFGDEFDVANTDRYLLYPLIASLSKGQRACLDFLSMYQIVSLGINGDETYKEVAQSLKLETVGDGATSVYTGIDRTVFGDEVALTGEAYKLQNSTGKSVMSRWESITVFTKALYIAFGVSLAASALSAASTHLMDFLAQKLDSASENYIKMADSCLNQARSDYGILDEAEMMSNKYMAKSRASVRGIGTAQTMQDVFYYAGIVFACVGIVLAVASIWRTVVDIKKYYDSEFTPIPMHMVDESVNENDEKVYVYYTAVTCNRKDAGMVTEETEILKDFGDLNGVVGKQWVALYTTKDKAAGNPITTDFKVQYENSTIPGERTPLSIFCENTAQNLTDEKSGYTYSDDKNGIYLFFGTDVNAYAGSVFSGNRYALVGGAAIVLLALSFFAGTKAGKKGSGRKNKEGGTVTA